MIVKPTSTPSVPLFCHILKSVHQFLQADLSYLKQNHKTIFYGLFLRHEALLRSLYQASTDSRNLQHVRPPHQFAWHY